MNISLNGDYLIKRGSRIGADGWINAHVPGNIQRDLELAGVIKPIRYGAIDDSLYDIALNDWWYKKSFYIDEEMNGARFTLLFEGVDYSCDIYLNNKFLGRNEGEFISFSLDATWATIIGSENLLEVKIDRMPPELYELIKKSDGARSGEGTAFHFVTANNVLRQKLKGLKCPGNMSYDWGTNIYTLGIWKDVSIRATKSARIDNFFVVAQPDENYESASVSVRAVIDGEATYVNFELEGNTYELKSMGNGLYLGEANIEGARLWFPAGYGEQALYDIAVTAYCDKVVSDSLHERFGIRKIEWELTESAPKNFKNKFALRLNGIPIRTMGSCYVSPDLLSGTCSDEAYYRLVKLARNCHMTALRQHGGQPIAHKAFYNACDELGIMIMVDFPVANCILETDDEFLANLDATIRSMVRQMRNHPSIIEWTGGNELEYHFNKSADRSALDVIQRACLDTDETRVFRDTCPIEGSRHAPWDYDPDRHYSFYNSDILDNFGEIPMMRYGEFGAQTPSNLETWLTDIPITSRWPISENDPILIRKNAVNAAFASEYWLMMRLVERIFGPIADLPALIREGQYLGAEGIRYAVDALRCKGRRVAGFTTWDYSEPWPNGAGSFLIDYDGQPVMMYEFMKQALEPVSLMLKYDSLLLDFFGENMAELMLVSDLKNEAQGLKFFVRATANNGDVYLEHEGSADIAPQEVKSLFKFKLNPPVMRVNGPSIIELRLKAPEGKIICERVYTFGTKGTFAPLAGLFTPVDNPGHDIGVPYAFTGTRGGNILSSKLELVDTQIVNDGKKMTFIVKNTGKMTALYIEVHPLTEYRTDYYVFDNFSIIPAGELREIVVTSDTPIDETGFRLHAWNCKEDIIIEPSEKLIAYIGRRDRTCAKFGECAVGEIKIENRTALASLFPRLVEGRFSIVFSSNKSRDISLKIYTCDRSVFGAAAKIRLGNFSQTIEMRPGLGVQKANFEQLALADDYDLDIPACFVANGENRLEIEMEYGWFTPDSIRISRGRV